MPATLASTSFPNRTSPVKRGVWVLEQVLGEGTADAVVTSGITGQIMLLAAGPKTNQLRAPPRSSPMNSTRISNPMPMA